MQKIKLIADDAGDLSADDIKQYNIEIVNFHIINKNDPTNEIKDIEFMYKLMAEKKDTNHKTSCPSAGEFFDAFEKYIKDGYAVLCSCITASFSGSFNSATVAKNMIIEKYPKAQIEIIDSKMNAVMKGLFEIEIAKLITAGQSFKDILKKIEDTKFSAKTFFCVENLTFLRAGGRIGALKSIVANTLHIKPIIIMKDGDITSGGMGLGLRKTMAKVLELTKSFFTRSGEIIKNYVFCIGYGINSLIGEELRQQCSKMLDIPEAEIKVRRIGPTTCTHTGPNVVGVGFCKKMI